MPQLNLGTGLASLLGGFAKQTTTNLQQQYAQEQRDREREKMRQERFQDAETERTRRDQEQQIQLQVEQNQRNKDVDVIGSLLGDPSKPFSSDMIRKAAEYDTRYNRNISPALSTITENLQGQPYIEINRPDMKGVIPNPNYVPKYTDKRVVRHEVNKANNETTEIVHRYDPNTDTPEMDSNDKPVEERGKSWKTIETNPNYTSGVGSSSFRLPKTTANQVNTLAKKYTDSVANAKIASQYLSTNASQSPFYNAEIKRLQDEEPDLSDAEIRQKAISNISDRGWTKAEQERQHFDDFITPLIASHPQADEFLQSEYDRAKGIPDKDVYWSDVVDGYKDGTLDNHAVNLLSQKYLAMYGQFPDKMAYNANTREREIVKEKPEPKEPRKSARQVSNEKTLIAKKPIKGKIDKATATEYVKKAGGDKDKARQMAKDDGYTF
jgi:hypothetical protein